MGVPLNKLKNTIAEITKAGAGISWNILDFDVRVAPLLSYVSQIAVLPESFQLTQRAAFHVLYRAPTNTFALAEFSGLKTLDYRRSDVRSQLAPPHLLARRLKPSWDGMLGSPLFVKWRFCISLLPSPSNPRRPGSPPHVGIRLLSWKILPKLLIIFLLMWLANALAAFINYTPAGFPSDWVPPVPRAPARFPSDWVPPV